MLLGAKDGKEYETVQIRGINSARVDCDVLHGVHLRQGLRSYHANSYLVHLNYPEIAISSISKALYIFPTILFAFPHHRIRTTIPAFWSKEYW
jgi:hypothetical protein